MSSAERLLQLMQEQKFCETELRMLAGQLEKHKQSRLHKGVRVLNSTLEGLGFMAVFLLTVVTFGGLFPVLNVTTEICTKKKKKPKPVELFSKGRQKVEKMSTDITAEIPRLLEELKTDAEEGGFCPEPDQVDQYVMTKVLTALARQSGLKGRVRINFSPAEPQIFMETTAIIGGPAVMVAVAGILAFFTFEVSGQKLKPLFDEGLQQLIKLMSTAGSNAEQVDGATGLASKLQQATDTWTGMIQKNQVTEACKSLRDTADQMQRINETLRQQFDSIKRTLDKSTRLCEEKLKKNKEEKTGNQKAVVTVTVYAKHSGNASQKAGAGVQTEGRQREQSSQQNRDRGRNEETEETRGHPRGTGGGQQGGDAGSQSDGDHSNDPDYQPSSSDEEDSDSDSDSDHSSYPTIQLSNRQDGDISSDFSNDATDQSSNSQDEIPMGLFNAHSINNKQLRISKLIEKFNLEVLTLTETWVKPKDGDQSLGKALPKEFKFYHQPRPVNEGGSGKTRGGGVATLYSKNLQGTRYPETLKFESFECVAADLRHDEWTQPMRTITVYRPPTEKKQEKNQPPEGNKKDKKKTKKVPFYEKFLEEFQNLLNRFSEDDCILITGDFNIWVNLNSAMESPQQDQFPLDLEDNKLCQHIKEETHKKQNTLDRNSAKRNPQQYQFATDFQKLLMDNKLSQHVKEQTHKKGNTLDLVITRNVDISNLCVKKPKTKIKLKIKKKTNEEIREDKTISDHYVVKFNARPTSKNVQKRKHTDPPPHWLSDSLRKQCKDREDSDSDSDSESESESKQFA